MRDPKRLDSFYEELKELHKEFLPDWRFGQFMSNFIMWMLNSQSIDVFFLEEGKLLSYVKRYIESIKMCDMMCGGVEEDED